MKKRMLSLLLALALALTLLPAVVLAEDAVIAPTENWYDETATELEIGSTADLLAFAEEANTHSNNFENKKITILSNIVTQDPIRQNTQ